MPLGNYIAKIYLLCLIITITINPLFHPLTNLKMCFFIQELPACMYPTPFILTRTCINKGLKWACDINENDACYIYSSHPLLTPMKKTWCSNRKRVNILFLLLSFCHLQILKEPCGREDEAIGLSQYYTRTLKKPYKQNHRNSESDITYHGRCAGCCSFSNSFVRENISSISKTRQHDK